MADPAHRGAAEARLGPVPFRMLCDRVRDYCGLRLGPQARARVARRVAERMDCLGESSVGAYSYSLREGPESQRELALLVDALTVKDTFFLREADALRVLVEEVIPQRFRAGEGGPVRVWSAGCASGEEPYTIAMLAAEAGVRLGAELEVFGSDIATSALARARRGLYSPSALRATPAALRERYFESRDGRFRVCEALRSHVEFVASNLVDANWIDWLGPMDVIVCRNVLTEFEPAARDRVVETFYRALRPGGHLLPGRADRWDISRLDFESIALADTVVYRRPALGEGAVNSWRWSAGPGAMKGIAD